MLKVEDRSRQHNWQLRQQQQGRCRRCGAPAGINPKTQKYFDHCPGCRPVVAEETRLRMRRYRARQREL